MTCKALRKKLFFEPDTSAVLKLNPLCGNVFTPEWLASSGKAANVVFFKVDTALLDHEFRQFHDQMFISQPPVKRLSIAGDGMHVKMLYCENGITLMNFQYKVKNIIRSSKAEVAKLRNNFGASIRPHPKQDRYSLLFLLKYDDCVLEGNEEKGL